MADIKLDHLDEQHRRGLQEYIFDLEMVKEKAEELTLAHERLTRSQDLLLTILSCTVHGLCLIKEDEFVWGNEAMAEIFGWSCDELAGRSIEVLCPDADAYRGMRRTFDAVLEAGGLISHEFEFVHKDGRRVPCFVTGRALDQKIPSRGYVLSIIDFTERRRAQEALKRAYGELEGRSAELVRINRALSREVEERKRAEEKLNSYSGRLEEQVRVRTAELVEVNEALRREVDERRHAEELLKSEIKMRREVEEALRASENEYRTIFENTGTSIIIVEEDMTISLVNAEFENLSGFLRNDIEWRKNWIEFIAAEEMPVLREYHRLRRIDPGAAPRQYESRFLNKDREVRYIGLTVAMIPGSKRSIASILDITVHKAMEAEALKAQKLESVGILAGGIAHDFNNILTSIVGNISLAKLSAPPGGKILSRLEETERASLRARDLTQQLLTFSVGGKPVKKCLSIAELIRESATFSLRGSNVRLDFVLPEDLWPVEADEGQIGQVVNNLSINADQAMPVGGIVRITAENVVAGPTSALPLPHGRYVKITLADQGIGIAEEHLAKIFDPYFSTKQKGSGLGLATVYSIIKSHGGHISVDSELKAGTSFTFYLPASEKEVPVAVVEGNGRLSGTGRILIMDDEAFIHEVLGDMLEFMGYETAIAHDGAEAIEVYTEAKLSGCSFDVVIMDLTIPGGMGGKEALNRLRVIDPDIRAIVSSGYSNDPVMADFEKYGFSGVVSKPYRLEELAEVLHRVM
ncbi:MAG: PAS domain S-box protein [Syntrophobacteraceae bacterium]